jgi:hypothetical protein
MDHRGPVETHDHPARPDLTESVAVVIPAPGFLYPRGGYQDSTGKWVDQPDDTGERFQPFLEGFADDVRSSLPAVLADAGADLVPRRYSYGPSRRAGMYELVNYVCLTSSLTLRARRNRWMPGSR